MDRYFYWCGLIINVIVAIGFLIGIGFSFAQWIEDIKEEGRFGKHKLWGRKNDGEDGIESEGSDYAAGRKARSDLEQS